MDAATTVSRISGSPPSLRRRALALTSLGALGVVYGDIGTSPLYAMKECLAWPYSPHAIEPTSGNVLGVLSLMIWALVLVVGVKYLVFVLRADNKGEGGILALAALVQRESGVAVESDLRPRRRLAIPILLGLFGAGLLFGDGAITPAISILGAMEGLGEQSPRIAHLAVPITVGIIIGVFIVQRHGTKRIGNAFGPVMFVWFVVIGVIGLRWIIVAPEVLVAFNPLYGAQFLASHGMHGFVLIGLVFLVVTGGEALYADMGHFGRTPIRIAWFTVVLPGLLLNYLGQGALFLTHPIGSIKNPFYAAVDEPLLIPLLVLATMAAVIASQALISGVFSLTRQAMQLGFWPRVTVVHTSPTTEGQIYIPEMNWIMMFTCIVLVLEFRTSSGLAAAYGIAVTGTMAITSYLFYLVCRQRWGYSRFEGLAFLVPFLAIDLAFFSANALKFLAGGWFPLALGVTVFTIMTTWWRGQLELSQVIANHVVPDPLFFGDPVLPCVPRVRGTGVFMTSVTSGIPNVVLHHLKHNQVLHQQVILVSVKTATVPWLNVLRTVEVQELGYGFFRVIAHVGFMQTPDIPGLLAKCSNKGVVAEPATTTYYLGRQTLLASGTSHLARWRKNLFTFLARNARSPTAFFNLPPNRVVELGLQIEL